MKRLLLVSALGVVGLALASPASAQLTTLPDLNRATYADERQPYNESRRVAYDNGYREGIKEGEKDARSRDVFNYQDERTWQRADKGYHRSYGDSQRYQQAFRTGYAGGYSDGYRRYAPSYGNDYPRGGVYPNTRGGYGYPQGGMAIRRVATPKVDTDTRTRAATATPVTTATARRTRTA